MLAYRREGSGPPLLLIHGWGVRYTIWRHLTPLLRPHFTLIKIEMPGIGGSPPIPDDRPYYPACADEIEALRKALGIEQWAVLSYSSGTRAAEAYVQRYPEHVSRVIFLCPARLTELSALGLRLTWWLDNTRPELADWVLSDWRLYGLVRALGFNGRGHHYANIWTSEIGQQSLEHLKRQLYELPGRGRAPFELPAVPTLFIWGRRDAIMVRPRRPARSGQRHVRTVSVRTPLLGDDPDSIPASHVSIPADHSAPMQAAEEIADVVLPFLTRGEVTPCEDAQADEQAEPVGVETRWHRLRSALNLTPAERAELNRLRTLLRRERDQFLRLLRERPTVRLPGLPRPRRPRRQTHPVYLPYAAPAPQARRRRRRSAARSRATARQRG
jgi:pimeloyl-ACP methyl ester carboxylesterase